MSRILLSTTIAGVLAAGAFAIGIDPVTIKFNAPAGQKFDFTLDGTIEMNGSHQLTGKEEDTVKAIDATGNITVESKSLEMSFDGQPFPQQDPTTTTYKPSGEISSYSGADQGPGVRLAELVAFYYPTMPVKEGDTYPIDIKPDSKTGGVPFHGDFKVLGTEKVGKYDTVKIDGQLKETGTEMGTSHNVYWVNVTDGMAVKETSDFANIPAGFGPMTGKTTMTRRN
jgi:hypothetical protein